MIAIDTSAIVAILYNESERNAFNAAIEASNVNVMSAASFLETTMVIEGQSGERGRHELQLFIRRAEIELIPFDETHATIACEAFRRFGKGYHPAGLNLGDCFSYALSRYTGYPLLYKGNDFRQTDIAAAL